MIFKENKIIQMPVGRHIQRLKSEFVLQQLPSWLSIDSTPSYSDNGIDVNGTITFPDVSLTNAEQISIDIYNTHWVSLPTNPSVKLVNGSKYIGIIGNNFVYFDGTDTVINEAMGILDSKVVWNWCGTAHATDYYLGSKNIGIVIQPQYGYCHVMYNGDPVHSVKINSTVIDNTPLSIDFSGDWHWEIYTGGKSMHASGFDVEVQMNI